MVIDFWATWCGPCQGAMPSTEKLYQEVKDKNVVVIGLCISDTKEAYKKWMAAAKGYYNFTFAYDPAGKSATNHIGQMYKVGGIPFTCIVDKDGKVAANLRYSDLYDAEKALEKLGLDFPVETAKTVAR